MSKNAWEKTSARNGRGGRSREGKGREGKGREGKGRGREGKGREREEREGRSISMLSPTEGKKARARAPMPRPDDAAHRRLPYSTLRSKLPYDVVASIMRALEQTASLVTEGGTAPQCCGSGGRRAPKE